MHAAAGGREGLFLLLFPFSLKLRNNLEVSNIQNLYKLQFTKIRGHSML